MSSNYVMYKSNINPNIIKKLEEMVKSKFNFNKFINFQFLSEKEKELKYLKSSAKEYLKQYELVNNKAKEKLSTKK